MILTKNGDLKYGSDSTKTIVVVGFFFFFFCNLVNMEKLFKFL